MIQNREYLFTINEVKDPKYVEGTQALAMRLMELLMMNPGSDPLHPSMGVGLRNYRFIDNISELEDKITEQIQVYLPMYDDVNVALIRTATKLLNIEITIAGTTFVYDSGSAPVPLSLNDL